MALELRSCVPFLHVKGWGKSCKFFSANKKNKENERNSSARLSERPGLLSSEPVAIFVKPLFVFNLSSPFWPMGALVITREWIGEKTTAVDPSIERCPRVCWRVHRVGRFLVGLWAQIKSCLCCCAYRRYSVLPVPAAYYFAASVWPCFFI